MTKINIRNHVQAIALHTTVTVGLSPDLYGISEAVIDPSGAIKPFLWFHRNNTIPNRQSFIFTTTFRIAAITVTIHTTLTGTPGLSRYNITVYAVDDYGQTGSAGTLDDTGTSSFHMQYTTDENRRRRLTIVVRREANGTFDDVVIELHKDKV